MYSQTDPNTSSPYDLLIVGMGPVGLAAAYEAAKNKKKILIIEKRPEATAAIRPQVIVLEPIRKKQLMDMIGQGEILDDSDIAFLDSLGTSAEIKLSTVQRFILNRIKNQSTSQNIAPVDMLYETTLQEGTDLRNGLAKLSTNGQEKIIHFNHLVAADGASSPTLELINPTLTEQEKIERKTSVDMQHLEETYHLGAYIKISLKNGQELELPEKEFVSSFLENKYGDEVIENQLYFLRFDKSSYDKSGKKSVKTGFIGEIPRDIYEKVKELNTEIHEFNVQRTKIQGKNPKSELDEMLITSLGNIISDKKKQKQNLVLSYVKKSCADYLGKKEDELDIEVTTSKTRPEKDSLKILTFQGGSKQANKAATQSNGHAFYLIGDAYFTPNYPAGHGLNDGLEAANLLGQIPKDSYLGDPDLIPHMEKYNSLCANNARFARVIMQGIHRARKLGIGRNLVAELLENTVDKREKRDKVDLKKNLSHTIFADAVTPEDSIEIFLKEKFNAFNITRLFNKGRYDYGVGFLSGESPDFAAKNELERLIFLQELSEKNKGIPILIKSLDSDNAPKYSLYRFNKHTHQHQLVDISNGPLIGKLETILKDKDVFADFNVMNNEISSYVIADVLSKSEPHDSRLPLHYHAADKEIEQKIEEWRSFIKNTPSIVKQYRIEISNRLRDLKDAFSGQENAALAEKFQVFQQEFEDIVKTHNDELITQAKKEPNKWDASGRSPLYHALQYGDIPTITTVLQAGANPNKACKYSFETVFTRRVLEKPEIARELLAHGANPFNSTKSSIFIASFLTNTESPHFSPKFGLECLLALSDPKCKTQRTNVTKIAESQIVQLKKRFSDSFYDLYLEKECASLAARISTLKKVPMPDNQEAQVKLIKEFVDDSLDKILKAKRGFFNSSNKVFFNTPKNTGKAEPNIGFDQEISSKA